MSLITRCKLIGLALLLGSSAAAAFPDKPVTLVVPAPPGGTADTVVRTLAPRLSAFLGHPVLVENKAGASGVIASQAVAGAAPDGHTLLMNYTSHAINPWLMAKLLSPFGVIEPPGFRRNRASRSSAYWSQHVFGVMEPGRFRHIGASQQG